MKTILSLSTLALLISLTIPAAPSLASAAPTPPFPTDLQLVPSDSLPGRGTTWWSVTRWGKYPGSPVNWLAGRTDVLYYRSPSFGTNKIIIDDALVDYSQTAQTNAMLASSMYSGGSPGPLSPNYGSNDIWLEIEDTNTPQTVDLTLHNPTVGLNWQLLSKTGLLDPNPWAWGEIQFADGTTNSLHYRELEDTNPPIRFFRAVGAPWILGIQKNSDPAVEPIPPAGIPGTNATFTLFFEQSATTNVTVYYSMSGVAVPGVDYSNWPGTMNGNIGSVVIPAGSPAQVTVQVQPLADPKIDFDEQAVFTLIVSNGYVVDPAFSSASITISDNFGPTNLFQVVATNIPNAVGID